MSMNSIIKHILKDYYQLTLVRWEMIKSNSLYIAKTTRGIFYCRIDSRMSHKRREQLEAIFLFLYQMEVSTFVPVLQNSKGSFITTFKSMNLYVMKNFGISVKLFDPQYKDLDDLFSRIAGLWGLSVDSQMITDGPFGLSRDSDSIYHAKKLLACSSACRGRDFLMECLDHAHLNWTTFTSLRGIGHGDLQKQNMLRDRSGKLLLTDLETLGAYEQMEDVAYLAVQSTLNGNFKVSFHIAERYKSVNQNGRLFCDLVIWTFIKEIILLSNQNIDILPFCQLLQRREIEIQELIACASR